MRYRKRYTKEEKSPERLELEKLIREHIQLSKMSQTAIINTLCRHGVDSIRKLVVITELELYKMGKLGVVRVTALMDLKRYLEEERELYRTHDETLAKVKELLDQGYMTDIVCHQLNLRPVIIDMYEKLKSTQSLAQLSDEIAECTGLYPGYITNTISDYNFRKRLEELEQNKKCLAEILRD